MNLASGEKVRHVVIASGVFGEINPGPMGLQQLELAVKETQSGGLEAEMKVAFAKGISVYKFPDLDTKALEKARLAFLTFARVAKQPGVFREYDFSDCSSEEEMRFRLLLIPEYRAIATIPKQKVVQLDDAKKIRKCPICRNEINLHQVKCGICGIRAYREGGSRYFESERASYLPLKLQETGEPVAHLLKVDYVNIKNSQVYPHVTYVEEPPAYLGAVFTFTPPVKPVEFSIILNKPVQLRVIGDIIPFPYRTRQVEKSDLEILRKHDVKVFCGTGTEPHLIVSFNVWDYTCLEEIGSHVNYILGIYNRYIDNLELTM